jgi:hypothetical protein
MSWVCTHFSNFPHEPINKCPNNNDESGWLSWVYFPLGSFSHIRSRQRTKWNCTCAKYSSVEEEGLKAKQITPYPIIGIRGYLMLAYVKTVMYVWLDSGNPRLVRIGQFVIHLITRYIMN